MENDDEQRSLTVLIGERLRLFREEQGLRQIDVVAAAGKCGLAWARSTVAALEAGTRNISLDELLLLPLVIAKAGGWDRPLLPPELTVWLNEKVSMDTTTINALLDGLHKPIGGNLEASLEGLKIAPSLPVATSAPGSLAEEQRDAIGATWASVCNELYPHVSIREVWIAAGVDKELMTRVEAKLNIPRLLPSGLNWQWIAVLSHGLWGRSFSKERDARVGPGEKFTNRRSLQSARGHVTRDLTKELQREIGMRKKFITKEFAKLVPILESPELLYEYSLSVYRSGQSDSDVLSGEE